MYGAQNGAGLPMIGGGENERVTARVMDVAASTPGKRESAMSREYSRQENVVGALCEMVEELRRRLEPVLAPVPPASEASGKQRPIHGVALADGIANLTDRIERVVGVLAEVNRRIEL